MTAHPPIRALVFDADGPHASRRRAQGDHRRQSRDARRGEDGRDAHRPRGEV